MRVLLDSRMLNMFGIGRYIQNLIIYNQKLFPQNEYLLAGDSFEIEQFLQKNEDNLNYRNFKIVKFKVPIYSVREQLYGSYLMQQKNDIDIIHVPHFNAPYFLPGKSVVTIHDITPFIFTQHSNIIKIQAARRVLSNAVKGAQRIITVSESTAQDLIKMFPVYGLQEKCRVIHNGVSHIFSPPDKNTVQAFKSKRELVQYILFVGRWAAHKNLGRLLQAYARLQGDFPGLQLVLAGQKGRPGDEVAVLRQKLCLNNLIEIDKLSDLELPYLYAGAEALVFPSLYEGFGLPPLEAMACGTPVVVSNCSSLPEVVGDAGIYVNPYDIEDIAEGIHKILINARLRREMVQKGLDRAQVFKWENTARQTMEVYSEALPRCSSVLKLLRSFR